MKNKKFTELHNEVGVTPLTQSINYGYPSREMGKLLGVKPLPFVGVYAKEKVVLYTDIDRWVNTGKMIAQKAKDDINFFQNLIKESEKIKKQTIKIIQGLGRLEELNFSNQKLVLLIKKLSYNGFMLSVYSQLGAIADHFHNTFTNILQDTLKNSKNFQIINLSPTEIFNILTTPCFKMPSEIAAEELLKLKDVDSYLNKWHWLNFGHIGPSFTRKQAIEKMKSGLKPENKLKLANKQKEIINKIFPRKEQRNLFEAARIFVYLKGMRMEVCNGVFSFLNRTTQYMEEKTKISKKNLMYLSIPELVEYFENEKMPSKSELAQRRNYSVWIFEDYNNSRCLIGEQGKKFIKENAVKEILDLSSKNEIKGNTAYAGKVRGIVKVVNSSKDMKKMKKGDIMVSIQTMPELLPAMTKAAAFVTDMGGITSHAAIVSREMSTPCIVGTRTATKILKDGDLVEVDAEKGVVKIIK